MLTVSDVSLRFSDRKLFDDVNIKFTEGNTYGLIGANGAGKSTFLKILAGDIEPTTGHVSLGPDERLSVLRQNHFDYEDERVIDVVIMGNEKLYNIMKEKDAIYMKEDFSDEDGVRAAELEGEFAELGALEQLDLIFENGKSMTRFVVDLLQYLRDILIVQAGGENTHHSDVFERNLDLPQDILFEMISLATKSLADIKASLQPKIYAEMMTIRLAEIDSKPELSGDVAEELSSLREEVARLKQALANVGSNPKQTVSTPSRLTNSKSIYRVDRNKVQSILQEAVENPDLARQNLIRLQNAWGEVIESLSGPDKALLAGSQPVAANEHHAILAFESNFNAGQTMKRDNLNTMFGNILSRAAGFSPEILAISMEEWKEVRAAFSSRAKGSQEQVNKEEPEESILPQGFEFLADKVTITED